MTKTDFAEIQAYETPSCREFPDFQQAPLCTSNSGANTPQLQDGDYDFEWEF